jgi:trk system potassium uptake protein TrkA
MATRIARGLAVPSVVDFIELSRDSSIVEVPAPAALVGKTLKDLALRPRFGLTLIAIRRPGPDGSEVTQVAPGPDDRVEAGDILALLGDNEKLGKIDKLLR